MKKIVKIHPRDYWDNLMNNEQFYKDSVFDPAKKRCPDGVHDMIDDIGIIISSDAPSGVPEEFKKYEEN